MKNLLDTPSSRPLVLAALAALSAIGLATHVNAQTRTWTTTTPTGDSGTWSDTTKWGGDVPDTVGESATFGAYANARSIALDADFTIGTLTIVPRTSGFISSTFALTGTNTLTLNTGFIVGGGTSITIAPNLAIAADQTWTTQNETGVAPVVLNGIVSGGGKITRSANGANTSAGIITFAGANTFFGGFTQTAALNTTRLGSSSTTSGGIITDGPLGTGTVTLNAGTLASNGATARSLSNNIVVGGTVNLGNSSQTGALTFSDTGLTTASTFALGSANNGNVSILRVGGTNLTFDQVIAESGGIGQSVNLASTSGTPTVTINRTKTSTGNILVGGTALVLATGAANSGSLIGVNGSITATGSNKFSSGSLISDNTALIATDAGNYSAVNGGKATVYNNGRVSFAADQTQATVAGLYAADSQVRLGLGSGSGAATVTESYNQSAIGNGRAGLVSASTGTVTYTGTLTSGSDNTFRVGGGLGTLSLTGSTLTGSARNVSIEGGGTVNSSADQNYTGTTAVNSALTLSGASGALSATSAISVNNSSLTLDNTTANANRLSNSAGITLNRGTLAMNGSTTAIAESIGTLTINSGYNIISMGTAAGAGNTKSITTDTLARTAGSVALFRGDNFGLASGGASAATRNLFIVNNAPTGGDLVGGGGANGMTNISIIPWARTGSGTTATGGNFLTFDSSNNSLRPLSTATEFAANVDTATNATDNVRQTVAATGTTTLLTADRTRNSFILTNTGATAATVGALGGFTLTVTSGAVDFFHNVGQNFTVNNGTIAFGSTAGVITNSGGSGSATALNAVVAGSGGVSFFANNANGLLQLGGANTFTGGITVGSNGTAAVTVSNDNNFGNTANIVTHAGGDLRFFSNTASARGLVLLGNVGNNTLSNAGTATEVWTGDVSGSGLLRLVNSVSTTIGFSLGGNNSYSGGTQIEGIAVTGSSNTALGTGTVTLIGANNNAAALTLTGAAPTLGGLRGTDGNVTINPTASTATLTVGSNNENTVFNGIIGEGSGKTGSVTKTGIGTLVLGGNNTYSGITTVDSGKLLVNGSLASGVSVSNGALLGGSGFVAGAISVDGTIAAGNSIGTLNTGTLSLNSGSTFALEINITAANAVTTDLVNVVGNLNLAGSPTLSRANLGSNIALNLGTVITFITYTGTWNGNTFAGLADDSTFTLGANQYQISYNGVSGLDNNVVLQVVPEPSTYAMILGGFGLLIGFQRLRRKSAEG